MGESVVLRKYFIGLTLTALMAFALLQGLSLDGDAYHQHSQVQFSWAITSLDDLDLRGDENILDVGCADGKVTAFLADRTKGLVVGLDPDAASIQRAREHYPNVQFVRQAFEDTEYESQFDLITCFCVLNWIPDKQTFLKKAAQALKPGGRLYIVMDGPPPPGAGQQLRELLSQPDWQEYLPLFRPPSSLPLSELQKVAEEFHLTPIMERQVAMPVIFDSYDKMVAWHLAIRSELRALPEARLQAYFRTFQRMVQNAYPQGDDGRIYAFPQRQDLLFQKVG